MGKSGKKTKPEVSVFYFVLFFIYLFIFCLSCRGLCDSFGCVMTCAVGWGV